MADQKISELTEKTTLATDDLLVIVDSAASPDETKKLKAQNMGVVDGELRLTPKASSTGPEGTVFFASDDKSVYVGVEE